MKALYIRTDFYGAEIDGGTAGVMRGFFCGINKLGHQVSLIASSKLNVEKVQKEYYFPYSKLFRNLPELYHIVYNSPFFRFTKKVIEKEKPDFIYLRHCAFHYLGALLKKKLNQKVILQIDSSEVWVKKNWGRTYFLKPLVWAEEMHFEHCDALVVVSEPLKNQLIEVGAKPEKIHVIPNGVDPDLFHPNIDGKSIRNKYNLKDSDFLIGFTGTFGKYHGLETLARAIKMVVAKIPNARFIFVGDGDERVIVEDILIADNVKDKVIITGMIPFAEIPEHLASCDILTLPSKNNDDGSEFFNSPIKLYEYLAMGKPIIASAIGQQKAVIQDGVNGFLIPEKNPEALANKIIEVYHNSNIEQIKIQARKDAIEKYDWKVNAQKVIDIVNSIKS